MFVLVACCAGKAAHAAPARDLYRSELFKRSRRYAEQLVAAEGGAWRILSALHGALYPDQVVEPYEQTLATMSRRERQAWAGRVLGELVAAGVAGQRVVILAGELYRRDLEPALAAIGCDVVVPLRGLGIGHQKQALGSLVC